jgi:regulator of sigma E protease
LQTIIAFLLVFGGVVFIHELGHFLFAKLFNIEVSEFALGFGPKLISKKIGETRYRINIIPLGGYVKIAGMDHDDSEDQRSFNFKPLWQRFLVIFTGPLMNFVLAFLLFFLVFLNTGVPSGTVVELGKLQPNSPAILAGLQSGDQVISINGQKVLGLREMIGTIESNPGQELSFQVERQGRLIEISVIPRADSETGLGKINAEIMEKPVLKKIGIVPAFKHGITWTFQVVVVIINGLREMITGKMAPDFTGPLGIAQLAGEAARSGFADLLWLAAVLSVNLGLFNLLPIPALDGGRLLFFVFEFVRGKPVDPKKEQIVHYVGFVLMMVLFLLVTYKDILKLT